MSHVDVSQDILLINKIEALAAVNEEIIVRLQGSSLSLLRTWSIKETLQDNQNVSERKLVIQEAGYHHRDLLTLCEPVKIQCIEDFFNDKLNYSVRSYSELTALNTSMLHIAKKYKLFGPTPAALSVLQQFKENYEAIQIALGALETRIRQREELIVTYQEKIDELNDRKTKLAGMQVELQKDILQVQQSFQREM